MPQPYSKPLIIEKLKTERKRLEQNLVRLRPEDMLQPGVVGEWSVNDVLAHLADWKAHRPVWIEAARNGDPVAEIEAGLKWGQFDEVKLKTALAVRSMPARSLYFFEMMPQARNVLDEIHTAI